MQLQFKSDQPGHTFLASYTFFPASVNKMNDHEVVWLNLDIYVQIDVMLLLKL